jgi:hypothetical protein
MGLSPVTIYKNILPKINCGDCDFPTCLAFASMVVNEKIPLSRCPHLASAVIQKYQEILQKQHEEGKYVKRDMSKDALKWAKTRACSITIEELENRIGGKLYHEGGNYVLHLPYFMDHLIISEQRIAYENGSPLNVWEQVFIYNHIAQKGGSRPTGKWKALEELPNSVSKTVSMRDSVEIPLLEAFEDAKELREAADSVGGVDITDKENFADLVVLFRPLPRIPIMLLFWKEDKEEGFEAKVKLLFDETVTEHLDLESIIFLSERLRQLLCERSPQKA